MLARNPSNPFSLVRGQPGFERVLQPVSVARGPTGERRVEGARDGARIYFFCLHSVSSRSVLPDDDEHFNDMQPVAHCRWVSGNRAFPFRIFDSNPDGWPRADLTSIGGFFEETVIV